ncbi:MAG: aminoglycoside phosphotransferase family protein [Planctomycetota bacterium]|nr:aminoglycoside phosphotransferase family protein [Planctomycetota bacterium]
MSSFPLPPDSPPGLEQILNGELWHRLLEEGKVFPLEEPIQHIRYLRLKPGACRVFLLGQERTGANQPPQGILLRIYSDIERSRKAFEKEKTRRPLPSPDGLVTFLDEESGVVGLPFPNDPEIPELRRIYEPDRFRRLALDFIPDYSTDDWRLQRSLTKFQLLAYKPGRRAVLKAKLKFRHLEENRKERVRVHLKIENKKHASRSIRQAQDISNATSICKSFRAPRFLGHASNGCLYGHEWNSGSQIDLTRSDLPLVLESIGKAISELHSLPLELRPLSPPQLLIDEVQTIKTDLNRLVPEYTNEVTATCDELAAALPDLSLQPSSLLHGDLHLDQFLLDEDRPVLVDFDRAGRGYSCLDIGSLLEDLRSRDVPESALTALVEKYQSVSSSPIALNNLLIGQAMSLMRRASEPLRNLEPDWIEKLLSAVKRSQHCLDRRSG